MTEMPLKPEKDQNTPKPKKWPKYFWNLKIDQNTP